MGIGYASIVTFNASECLLSVQVSGGLGNQILNLGAMVWLQNETQMKIEIDTCRFDTSAGIRAELKAHTPRELHLKNLDFKVGEENLTFDYVSRKANRPLPFEYRTRLFLQSLSPNLLSQYWARPWTFDTDLLKLKKSMRIKGNLLNFEYLERAISLGLKNPSPREKSKDFLKILNFITQNQPIGVHIRGGDFLKTYSDFLPSAQYYQQSIQEISKENVKNDVLIFTDDLNYARMVISETRIDKNRCIFLAERFSLSTVEEYAAMTHLNRLICSTSSFSGTAARFLDRVDATVVVPDKLVSLYHMRDLPYNHFLKTANKKDL